MGMQEGTSWYVIVSQLFNSNLMEMLKIKDKTCNQGLVQNIHVLILYCISVCDHNSSFIIRP